MKKKPKKYNLFLFPSGMSILSAVFWIFFLAVLPVGLLSNPGIAGIDDNLKGAQPSNESEWRYHGFNAEESEQWIKAGIIFAAWAAQWRDEGVNAAAAGKWKKIANVYIAGNFLKNGFDPQEAEEWIATGIRSGLRAREYTEAGLTANEAAAFWENGIYPDKVKEWHDAGFDAQSMVEWHYGPRKSAFFFTKELPSSRAVYPLGTAVQWREAGLTAREAHLSAIYGLGLDEAIKWGQAGFSFDEAVQWKDSGFTFSEAFVNKNAGLTPAAADLKQYDESNTRGDEIASFHTDITVNADGTIDVVETIVFINRPGGAYENEYFKEFRRIETMMSLRSHGFSKTIQSRPSYRLSSLGVDGTLEKINLKKGVLRVGKSRHNNTDKARLISIAYQTDSRVLHEPHHDEFYFGIVKKNPPGRYIRQASATVRLPEGAQVVFADGLAGLGQRKDFYWQVEETSAGDIVRYSVLRPIREEMDFVVNVGFTKGIVRESLLRKLVQLDFRSGNFFSSLAVFLLGFTIALSYYLIAWYYVGRDPKGFEKQAVKFSVSDEIDPASFRALFKKGKTDYLGASGELLFLAEKRMIRITESQGIYKVEKISTEPSGLPAIANAFFEALFTGGSPVYLTRRDKSKAVADAACVVKTLLKKQHAAATATNYVYLWPGLIVSFLSIVGCLVILDYQTLENQAIMIAVLFYAGFLVVAFSLLSFTFMRLLRLPTEASVTRRQRAAGYARFLRRDFAGHDKPGFISPNLRMHLPYAITAGIAVNHLMIRNGETKWYHGTSGGFDCGDFIKMVKKSI